MELRQLRYFIATAEDLSFSRAARRLRLAQPALSQQIKHLEEELEARLFTRNSRGVQLTAAGERLLEQARAIVEQVALLPAAVKDDDSEVHGEVRIGLPGTVSEVLAVPLITACRARHPQVRIKVVEAMSGYIRDWLIGGRVDLAVLYSSAEAAADGLAMHEVLTEEVCLFAVPALIPPGGPDGALPFAALSALQLILPGRAHGLRELVEQAADGAGMSLAVAVEIDSYGQIKELAAQRLGCGLLPRRAVQREAEGGQFDVRRIVDPALKRKIFLVWPDRRPVAPATAAVSTLAWETLRTLVTSGRWSATLSDNAAAPAIR